MTNSNRMTIVRWLVLPVLFLAASCSRSNNLLEGRVESQVGDYVVVVTDCYRISVPPPERLADTQQGQVAYRFAPCSDALIEFQGDEVIVNGVPYGTVQPGDTITVDHGHVLINESTATATES